MTSNINNDKNSNNSKIEKKEKKEKVVSIVKKGIRLISHSTRKSLETTGTIGAKNKPDLEALIKALKASKVKTTSEIESNDYGFIVKVLAPTEKVLRLVIRKFKGEGDSIYNGNPSRYLASKN
jgi:hypothetical protein